MTESIKNDISAWRVFIRVDSIKCRKNKISENFIESSLFRSQIILYNFNVHEILRGTSCGAKKLFHELVILCLLGGLYQSHWLGF